MMNYQKKMEEQLMALGQQRPPLLLHVCCAPCSSYVLEALSPYFTITVYFDNPNMDTLLEYEKRGAEVERLCKSLLVDAVIAPYEPEAFAKIARGMEDEPEGGSRCTRCYRLRMERAARYAKAHGFGYFTTTLSISPHKDASRLNQIGEGLADDTLQYLYGDFKKKGGYQRSIVLSREYQLYRQNYCGCAFSKGKQKDE